MKFKASYGGWDGTLFIKKLLKKHIFPSYTQGIHYGRNSFPSSSIAPCSEFPKTNFLFPLHDNYSLPFIT